MTSILYKWDCTFQRFSQFSPPPPNQTLLAIPPDVVEVSEESLDDENPQPSSHIAPQQSFRAESGMSSLAPDWNQGRDSIFSKPLSGTFALEEGRMLRKDGRRRTILIGKHHDGVNLRTVDELSQLSLDPKAGNVDNFDTDRQGQWLRRRRLDGALNRVPVGFYTEIWKLLKRCHGITIENYTLLQSLTREMTPGEMKFALEVEKVLNLIPQPEYRQLMVEAMMVLCMVVEHDNGKTHWNQTIGIERIVVTAHESFIQEQLHLGDETMTDPQKGSAGLSVDFYDTAPSGRYGTMSYMCKAVAQLLQFPQTEDGNLDCAVS